MKTKRIAPGKYETLDGRYTIQRDVDHVAYDQWYLDRHPEIAFSKSPDAGFYEVPIWNIWDNELDDYPNRENRYFDSKRDAVAWLAGHLASQS